MNPDYFKNKIKFITSNAESFAEVIEPYMSDYENFNTSDYNLVDVSIDEDANVILRFEDYWAGQSEYIVYTHPVSDFWDTDSTAATIKRYREAAHARAALESKMSVEAEKKSSSRNRRKRACRVATSNREIRIR